MKNFNNIDNNSKFQELEDDCAALINKIAFIQNVNDLGLNKFLGELKGAFINLQLQIETVNLELKSKEFKKSAS